METYKIGNKVSGVIRAFSAGKIGDQTIQYDNQPYTTVFGKEMSLTFRNYSKSANAVNNKVLYYDAHQLAEVTIRDVSLTDKILNLIYSKNEEKLCTKIENCVSDKNFKIFLNTVEDELYQVFVFNQDGDLESAYGTLEGNVLTVENDESSYLIVYSYIGEKAYSLDKPNNYYLTLDLQIEGNEDDQTSMMFLHIEKCGLRVDQNMRFQNRGNAVDLIFEVISTSNNYITFKE